MVMTGIYRHYKGGLYRVLHNATISTNGPDVGDPVVVYMSMKHGSIHVRDEDEFNEIVKFTGEDGRTRHEHRFNFLHTERVL